MENWISVSERMPDVCPASKTSKHVLCACEDDPTYGVNYFYRTLYYHQESGKWKIDFNTPVKWNIKYWQYIIPVSK